MKRWEVFLLTVIIVTAATGWWMFGYSKFRGPTMHGHRYVPAGRTLWTYRSMGREVRLDIDDDGDGRVDQSSRYSRECPAEWHCPPRLIVSDRDRDGRWDLWIDPQNVDDQGYSRARYRVDTDRNGRPDWTFVGREVDADERIRARRGF